ncbi:hypothetical protein PbJCM13498_33510 [Prolixibacter bellariivorans]|uniref:Seryl-tRNA synthetase n=2 Tax=Prolixibacter bellariivorans TaxID=314319 RepID=A0A5M4B3J0_9BACT|nr:hypothetical protein PbJCM13498_33510 [Prolixibacter bellariivorans]
MVMIFTLSASMAFGNSTNLKSDSEKSAVPAKTENKLSAEEISRLTKRVEEIRSMDKTNMTVKEKREMRKELKEIKKNVKRSGGTIVIGGVSLLLIIIIIILLV